MTYRLTQEARDDLRRIHNYGWDNWGEVAADSYYNALFDRFEEIALRPYSYPAVEYIRAGYRRSVCGVDSIYYRVADDGIVEIMAILGSQDAGQFYEWVSFRTRLRPFCIRLAYRCVCGIRSCRASSESSMPNSRQDIGFATGLPALARARPSCKMSPPSLRSCRLLFPFPSCASPLATAAVNWAARKRHCPGFKSVPKKPAPAGEPDRRPSAGPPAAEAAVPTP